MVSEVAGLDAGQLLDAVETWCAVKAQAERNIFVAAAHFADLHAPDAARRRGAVLPGMERPVRLGGQGTPRVLEFAPALLGMRLGRSTHAARSLLADALDTRHRLPGLWARVCAGEVPVGCARHVAQATRELDADAAGRVDAAVATYADGRLPWSRFVALVAGKVTEADPDLAAEQERQAAEETFARVGRCNEHGHKTLYVRTPAAAMTRIDATVQYVADVLAALGDEDGVDARRAKALLVLANPVQAVQLLQTFAAHRAAQSEGPGNARTGTAEPDDGPDPLDLDDTKDTDDTDGPDDDTDDDGSPGTAASSPVAGFFQPFRPHTIKPETGWVWGFDPRKLLPRVVLYLHLHVDPATGKVGPVARWEGEGPVTTTYLRKVLGPACAFTIKPVLDLPGMAPVDGYEIPDRMREAVHLRCPAEVFPWGTHTSRRQQADHTKPYQPPDHGGPPGQTGLHNLGGLSTLHHRIKTHTSLEVKQPFPGIWLWRDPHGRIYLVDHTGTRKLGTTTSGRDLPDLTAHIHPADGKIDYTPHHTG